MAFPSWGFIYKTSNNFLNNIHSVIFGAQSQDLAPLYDSVACEWGHVDVLNALSCFTDLSYIIAPWPYSDTLGS